MSRKGITAKSINAIFAHAFSCMIISFGMLYFSYLSLIESNESLAIRYLAVSSVSFSLTILGYWGYCRYYASKQEHSPTLDIVYTLFFGFVFLFSDKYK